MPKRAGQAAAGRWTAEPGALVSAAVLVVVVATIISARAATGRIRAPV